MIILIILAVIVGMLIGTVGVGGILLIPALVIWGGLSTHMAMATALFSFIFTGILGTWLYQRHGSINWDITVPICAGAIAGAYPGTMANSMASGAILDLILGALIIFAGIYALFPAKGEARTIKRGDFQQKLWLFLIGALVGLGSGFTGVGGPVLSVPLMVILGFNPLAAIATSQVIQIAAAISGSLGNLVNGFIRPGIGLLVGIAELAGVALGAYCAHRMPQVFLKKIIAIVCMIVGAFIIIRTFIQ